MNPYISAPKNPLYFSLFLLAVIFLEYYWNISYNDLIIQPKPNFRSRTFFEGRCIMYTIGQVSEMYNLPISTLRYYDKEGFFPNLMRKGNIRYFSDDELEAIRVIECLKRSGLEIKDIKQFFQWVMEGPSSYGKRKEMFETRKAAVEDEIKALERTLALLKFKCWYYETAIKDGNEDGINAMLPDKLPEEIQELYDISHE